MEKTGNTIGMSKKENCSESHFLKVTTSVFWEYFTIFSFFIFQRRFRNYRNLRFSF